MKIKGLLQFLGGGTHYYFGQVNVSLCTGTVVVHDKDLPHLQISPVSI